MRITTTFLLAFFLTITCRAQSPLHVSGTQLMDAENKPIVLRGVSFGWHNYHPRFYTAGAVKWLKQDWRCNVVRAAIGVEPKNGYLEDSATAIKLLTNVVDAAIGQNMYVIIDWHSHNIRLPQAVSFFTMMAKKYGKSPNVIYELFNEPDYESWAEVKSYSVAVIAAIRAIDPDNLILVGSPHWDQDVLLPAKDPIKGYDNIMYTLHYYAATHGALLRSRADSALQLGLPLFISESAGMEATGDGAINQVEWNNWITWSKAHKMSWVTWSVSDKDETCSMLNTIAKANGHWKMKELKTSGKLTRKSLRNY